MEEYFSVQATFVRLDGTPDWTVTLHDSGHHAGQKDCRWLGSGSIDRFTLHDILKVMDCRVESLLIRHLGLQTMLDMT